MEIVLYQPEIAGNVGAIIRLAANSGVSLNLIKPFGFDLQENKIRRAGLDYHDLSNTKTYNSWEEFKEKNTKKNIKLLNPIFFLNKSIIIKNITNIKANSLLVSPNNKAAPT